MTKTEWQPQDIKDFLSDFCSVTDEESIRDRAFQIFGHLLMKGTDRDYAEAFADGYEKALMDIYKQI